MPTCPQTMIARLSMAILPLLGLSCGEEPERAKPSILLITLDTTRADRLGAYGFDGVETKALDRLAREGALFENAIAPVPLTLPSHATLFSGLDPTAHGIHENGRWRYGSALPSMTEELSDSGYKTAAFVSAFVLNKKFGLDRGFDVYDDVESDHQEAEGIVLDFRPDERSIDDVTLAAQNWLGKTLRERGDTPYFCWVHLYAPHFPYAAPEPFRSRYAHDPYLGEIAWVDAKVEELVRLIDDRGEEDQTYVVVVADHGEALGDHDEDTHGLLIYEECMRVPLIMRGPGIPPGQRLGGVAPMKDIAPTLLELVGLEIPGAMHGESMVAALRGDEDLSDRVAYTESRYAALQFGWSPLQAIRSQQYKFIQAPREELYDLIADPIESENLIDERQDVAERLRKRLRNEIETAQSANIAAEELDLTDEMKRRLQGLGYVSSGTGATPQEGQSDKDPKALTSVFRRLNRLPRYQMSKVTAERIAESRLILRDDPDNPLALEHLGAGLASLNRWGEAKEPLEKALEVGQKTVEVHYRLGLVYLNSGALPQAQVQLEAAVELNPNESIPYRYLGYICEQIGNEDQAIFYYRKFLNLYEGDPVWSDPIERRLSALSDAKRGGP